MRPLTVWFTGLSGAGKTTLASALKESLEKAAIKTVLLDGDEIRKLAPSLGFSREERDKNVGLVAQRARELVDEGNVVLVSMISPYRVARESARRLIGNFVEVYVSTPLEVCEARDPKGLYSRARKGEIRQFTGIDDPYEPPTQAEITLQTSEQSIEQCVQKVLDFTGLLAKKAS